jgi:hypothetical protein
MAYLWIVITDSSLLKYFRSQRAVKLTVVTRRFKFANSPLLKQSCSIYDPRTVSMRTETASGTHPCRVVTFTAAATPAMATVTGMGTLHYS